MWTIIYNQLKKQPIKPIKEYCYFFLKIINQEHSIWTLEELETKLSTDNGLFPQSANIEEHFNSGNIIFIINYILLFPEINKYWFDFDDIFKNKNAIESYELLFNLQNKQSILHHALFFPEKLLSKTTNNRQLSFLFFLYLPYFSGKSFFYHYLTNKPLLSYFELSNENFDMLLILMKELIPNEFKLLNEHKNLNHLLVENFMEQTKNLPSFEENIEWNEILPTYKIYKLLDENCCFNNFRQVMMPKYESVFLNINYILLNLEKEYFHNKLNDMLKINTKIENITKI